MGPTMFLIRAPGQTRFEVYSVPTDATVKFPNLPSLQYSARHSFDSVMSLILEFVSDTIISSIAHAFTPLYDTT